MSSGAPSPPGSSRSATRSPSGPATRRPRWPAPSPTATATRRTPRGRTSQPAVTLATFADAAAGAEVIVNATSGGASLAVLTEAGESNLAGKLLVDIANPLDFSHGMPPSLDPVNTDSLGEQIQRAFPAARVVKTLNTMNAR